jgi:hypothetical protein
MGRDRDAAKRYDIIQDEAWLIFRECESGNNQGWAGTVNVNASSGKIYIAERYVISPLHCESILKFEGFERVRLRSMDTKDGIIVMVFYINKVGTIKRTKHGLSWSGWYSPSALKISL